MTTYRVKLKRLVDGRYYARCDAAPNGLAEGHGKDPDEAVEQLRKEIRYQLEYCPCSGAARQSETIQLQISRVARPSSR